jgi:hypothetical protein
MDPLSRMWYWVIHPPTGSLARVTEFVMLLNKPLHKCGIGSYNFTTWSLTRAAALARFVLPVRSHQPAACQDLGKRQSLQLFGPPKRPLEVLSALSQMSSEGFDLPTQPPFHALLFASPFVQQSSAFKKAHPFLQQLSDHKRGHLFLQQIDLESVSPPTK